MSGHLLTLVDVTQWDTPLCKANHMHVSGAALVRITMRAHLYWPSAPFWTPGAYTPTP
jgi:hypothetical protein